MHGKAAIEALGDRLPAVARLNQRSAAALTRLLTDDPTMWLDKTGRLFVKEALPSDQAAMSPLSSAAASYPLDETFTLHSLPGSHRTIYLDFDGVSVGNIAWTGMGLPQGDHPGWDPMQDGAGFSDRERAAIQETWARVAEDFAPFDVDVTTQDPGEAALTRSSSSDLDYGTHLVVTDSLTAWQTLCSQACGGLAWIGRFGAVEPASDYQLAWVFSTGAGGIARTVAEAAAHEVGHTFDLTHDGTHADGDDSYYEGHEPWAPIMGAAYDQGVTQWSNGDYADANNQQDDVAVIAELAPLRTDEAGATPATAVQVPTGTAYITSRADVDYYALGSCEGPVTVAAQPAAMGADLDLALTVVDSTGDPVAAGAPATAAPAGPVPYPWEDGLVMQAPVVTGMAAAISVSLPAGDYFAVVDGGGAAAGGSGDPVTDYDDYGSLGAYTLSTTGCTAAGTVPGAPSQPTVTITAADGLTAIWGAPDDDGGAPLAGYDVSLDGGAPVRVAANVTSRTWPAITTGSHTVSVAAVNSHGSSVAATGAARRTAPGAPVLLGTSVGPGSLADPDDPDPTLYFWTHWAPPADDGGSAVVGYRLEIDLGLGWELMREVPAAPGENAMTDYGVGLSLYPGAYPVPLRVIALNEVGNGDPLGLEGAIPGPPPLIGEAGDVIFTVDKLARTVKVDWRVPYDGGSPLLGTRIGLRTFVAGESDVAWPVHQSFDVGPDTFSVVFTDVPAGTNTVTIEPYNVYGARQQRIAVEMPQLLPPDQVNRFDPIAVDARQGTATISWEAPDTDPLLPILGYDVSLDDGAPVRVTDLTYTVTGLALGSQHTFNVSAVNLAGGSTPWPQLFRVVTTPAPVRDLHVSVDDSDPADLRVHGSWTLPVDNGGEPGEVGEYRWRLQPDDGAEAPWLTSFEPSGWASAVTPGDYSLQVRAHNVHGDSETVSVPVTVSAPDAPGAVTDLRVEDGDPSAGYAVVRWTAPAGATPAVTYWVDVTDETTNETQARAEAYGDWTPIQALTAGHTYRIVVTSVGATGPSAPSAVLFTLAYGAPGEVASLQTFANAADGTVTITWNPPNRTGGAPITHYDVRIDGGEWLQLADTAWRHIFEHVAAGEHVVEVRAANAATDDDGRPLQSIATSTVLMPAPPVAPGAVRNLRAVPDAAHGLISLSWSPPGDDGGSPVVEYLVSVGARSYTTRATSLTVTGLTLGATYRITVAAHNLAGVGPSSAQSASLRTMPAAPRIGRAKPGRRGGAKTAVFAWLPPVVTGGSAVTGYQITVTTMKKRRKTSSRIFTVAATARSLEVRLALKKNVTYTAVVRARNVVGWGASSQRSKGVRPR